ncbi:hypothetical protein D9619_005099 [Psilocybe cf. subviscida]|uniref:Uncharacterized protein n=1 Tax=Psilocybe cf. subviscida TaxID=2480587 RepID=A0A8H5BQP8_9AGAR|nr:hypothetical protein D9619_005099 [Psilocybe cf. subviscida]
MQFILKLSAVLVSVVMATQIGAAPAESFQHKRIVIVTPLLQLGSTNVLSTAGSQKDRPRRQGFAAGS